MANLTIENWINIVSIILSALISIISISIAIKTLKLTSKSIDDSNKPYISAYFSKIHIYKKPVYYLIIKNFGKSGATILNVTFENEFDVFIEILKNPINKIKNFYLCPNQKFIFALDFKAPKDEYICNIKYEYNKQIFNERIILNGKSFSVGTNLTLEPNNEDFENTIRFIANEFLRHNL